MGEVKQKGKGRMMGNVSCRRERKTQVTRPEFSLQETSKKKRKGFKSGAGENSKQEGEG